MISLLIWIVLGFLAGYIAKMIMPGPDGGGFILTTILGIVGAVVTLMGLLAYFLPNLERSRNISREVHLASPEVDA